VSHSHSTAGVVFWTAVVHVALLGHYLTVYGDDPSAFVCADRDKIGRPPFEVVHIGFPNGGYDGQWYYVIARNPWGPQSAGMTDLPAYRHVRILYPALAWLLSGGHRVALLWVLPLINLAAIVAMAWYGARLGMHYGRSPWWGFALPIIVNAGMPALRDLNDPLAAAALVAMLAAYFLEMPAWQLATWAAAAALGREQNALIVLLTLADAAYRRRRNQALALAAGLAVWAGWVAVVTSWYGDWPTSPANVGTPMSGIAHCILHLTGRYGRPAAVNMIGMSVILLQFVLCGMLTMQHPQPLTAGIALAGVGLAVFGGPAVYESAWSYSRVFIWMPLAVWLWSMQSGRSWPAILLLAAVVWPLLASVQAWLK
jgi:hypothetical protein